jgi:delta 1-pyrroline-5-carboxylate dehydrogenase
MAQQTIDGFTLPDVEGLTAQRRAEGQQLLQGQKAEQGGYLDRFRGAIMGQEGLPQMASRIGSELNLPTLSENAFKLQQTVRNLPQTYSKATRGFDVNANQLSRIIGMQQSKLAPLAQEATMQAQNAINQRNEMMGFTQAQQQKELTPFQTEQNLMTERMARETSMFSEANQSELNAILQKMSTGAQLSSAEKDRAQQLAIAEMNFEMQKQQLSQNQNQFQQQFNAQSSKPNTQVIEVNGQKKLIDTSTGQVISSYGSSPTATKASTSYFKPSSNYLPNQQKTFNIWGN